MSSNEIFALRKQGRAVEDHILTRFECSFQLFGEGHALHHQLPRLPREVIHDLPVLDDCEPPGLLIHPRGGPDRGIKQSVYDLFGHGPVQIAPHTSSAFNAKIQLHG